MTALFLVKIIFIKIRLPKIPITTYFTYAEASAVRCNFADLALTFLGTDVFTIDYTVNYGSLRHVANI